MTDRAAIAQMIDHALLHPTLTDDDIVAGCQLAARLGVKSVCVKPYAVPLACETLLGTTVAVGTVIGFPHGACPTEIKVAEADWACRNGAVELDMVVNIGKVLQEDWRYVREDIQGVVGVVRRHWALVKVIFETDFVTNDDHKRRLCEICTQGGVDFVKTSTGFGFVQQTDGGFSYRGATEHDVRLMRQSCGRTVGVKASGGIRTIEDVLRFADLGATRVGTSSSQHILEAVAASEAGY